MDRSTKTQPATISLRYAYILTVLLVLFLTSALQAAPSKSDRLTLQNGIDKHEFLDKAFFPWAHNAYNSTAHGALGAFKNQNISVTAQLNAGQRFIDLDPQYIKPFWWSGDIRLCHNACIGTEQFLRERIQDIKNWFNADSSRYDNEVVIINLETYNHNMLSSSGFQYNMATSQINNIMGGDIYKPHYRCHALDDLASSTTKADVLAAGKNIILVGAGDGNQGLYSSCSSFYGNWGLWVFTVDYTNGPLVDYGSFNGYPSCSGGGFPGQSRFSYAYNDIFTGGGGGTDMSLSEMKALVGCGVNAISYEAFAVNSSQHEALIWCWQSGEPNAGSSSSLNCAKHTTAGLSDRICTAGHRYACKHMTTGQWKVTSGYGPWTDGAQACYQAFGPDYAFAVPANGYHANQMQDAKPFSSAQVWVNYTDLKEHGNWEAMKQLSETRFLFDTGPDGDYQRTSSIPMATNASRSQDRFGNLSAYRFSHGLSTIMSGIWEPVINKTLTISLWFRADSRARLSNWPRLVEFSADGTNQTSTAIAFDRDGSLRAWCENGDDGALKGLIDPSNNYQDDQWYHVAYVNDGTTAELYVDGQKVGQTSGCSNVKDPKYLTIGSRYGQSGNSFEGDIDDVMIYGFALSKSEIQDLAADR